MDFRFVLHSLSSLFKYTHFISVQWPYFRKRLFRLYSDFIPTLFRLYFQFIRHFIFTLFLIYSGTLFLIYSSTLFLIYSGTLFLIYSGSLFRPVYFHFISAFYFASLFSFYSELQRLYFILFRNCNDFISASLF